MSENIIKKNPEVSPRAGKCFEFIWNNPDEMALSIISFEMPDGL